LTHHIFCDLPEGVRRAEGRTLLGEAGSIKSTRGLAQEAATTHWSLVASELYAKVAHPDGG
jgi:hypothetical protein